MYKYWPTKKLEEIAEIYAGGRNKITKRDYIEHGFPAYSASGQDGFTKKAYDSGDAVILSSIGSRCGKCFYAEGKWTALANTQVIKFKNQITAKFMFYYLNDEKKWPKSGTGQPFISPSVVKNFIVPLPPLPVQQKIVSLLDTIQSAVEVQEKIIEKTKELKKSMMADLFKYGGPSFRKGRKLKKTEIGEIPEEWGVVKLGDKDLFEIKGGKRLPKGHNFAEDKTPYPYIRVIDFKDNSVDTNNLKYLTPRDYQILKNYFITKEDVYISIAGTIGLVGTIPDQLDGAILTENAAKIVIRDKNLIERNFLSLFLSSFKGQNQIKALTSKSTQPKLALYRIRQIKIPLPSLPEQQEIAEILQTIDQKIEIEQKKKALYEELFKTMLNKLMTGEIDVEKIKI